MLIWFALFDVLAMISTERYVQKRDRLWVYKGDIFYIYSFSKERLELVFMLKQQLKTVSQVINNKV